MNKSQSATEFMLLIAAVLLIFLPLFYIFTNYGFKSDTEMNAGKINEMGKKLVLESREIYYLGLWSKEVITFSVPPGINSLETLVINPNTGNEEYYLLIEYQKGADVIELAIPSEVPLISENCGTTCPTGVTNCKVCSMSPKSFIEGTRDFKIEAVDTTGLSDTLAINISSTII